MKRKIILSCFLLIIASILFACKANNPIVPANNNIIYENSFETASELSDFGFTENIDSVSGHYGKKSIIVHGGIYEQVSMHKIVASDSGSYLLSCWIKTFTQGQAGLYLQRGNSNIAVRGSIITTKTSSWEYCIGDSAMQFNKGDTISICIDHGGCTAEKWIDYIEVFKPDK
ncbi:MAG: hypothetical protein ABSG15_06710 [FCB group bacterium]